MARGINKVILIGNLGNDPEIRSMPNGSAVANLSVATTEGWRDRQSGERQEKTEWHRVVLFERQAEVARDYLRKGSKIYIEGRLQTRKWQDKNGMDRWTTEIVGRDMQMLDSRGDARPGVGEDFGQQPQYGAQPPQHGAQPPQHGAQPPQHGSSACPPRAPSARFGGLHRPPSQLRSPFPPAPS